MTATLRERAEHAARHGAHLVVPAADVKHLLDQLDQAETRIKALRSLHTDDGSGFCAHCTRGRIYHVPSPCDTTAVLTEAGDPQ